MTSSADKHAIKKTATLGLILALALIFSYVEFLIPVPVPVPGIKLGLANSMVLILLFHYRGRVAVLISLLRVVLAGFLFGNLSMILYSLSGALCSILVMWTAKKSDRFTIAGVSMLGGVAHNAGQLLLAALILETPMLGYYFPVLLVSGCLTGGVTGLIGREILKRVRFPE